MGMICEVNSILKLSETNGFPETLEPGVLYEAVKDDYRILLVDVPVMLVDSQWYGHADVIIKKLTWEASKTTVQFMLHRLYDAPFLTKDD
ncbi:MAG: DUF2584 family protein [Armatimonas sp.]